jgi:hypothetical protein
MKARLIAGLVAASVDDSDCPETSRESALYRFIDDDLLHPLAGGSLSRSTDPLWAASPFDAVNIREVALFGAFRSLPRWRSGAEFACRGHD